MEGHTYLAKVSARAPETGTRFMFITFAEGFGQVLSTTGPVDEKEMRKAMQEMGMSPEMIEDQIASAPVVR